MFQNQGTDNFYDIGNNVVLKGHIKGSANKVHIMNAKHECNLELYIGGNNNTVYIDSAFAIKGLKIYIGNHVTANNATLKISEGFSIEGGGIFFLYNSGNRLQIGKNCMFSNKITIRCGDSPHLLFDKVTGEYLDVSEGVYIGDHVWIGEDVYITKKVTIPSECVVGAKSVVTKRFEKEYCVLAGNPAKVVREDIQWIRNHGHLVEGSNYKQSYDFFRNKYK